MGRGHCTSLESFASIKIVNSERTRARRTAMSGSSGAADRSCRTATPKRYPGRDLELESADAHGGQLHVPGRGNVLERDLETAMFAWSYRRSDRRQYRARFPQRDLIHIVGKLDGNFHTSQRGITAIDEFPG